MNPPRRFQEVVHALEDPQITSLDLSHRSITCREARGIIESLRNTHITSLNLSNNHIGCSGVLAIAENLKHTSITNLNLENNEINNRGTIAIAYNLEDTEITCLNLAENLINARGVLAITTNLKNSKLTHLDLQGNIIERYAEKSIANELRNSKIESLNVMNNDFKAGGGSLIKASKQFHHITCLKMSFVQDPYRRVSPLNLSNDLKDSRITTLNFTGDIINDAEIEAIAKILQYTSITCLGITHNRIISLQSIEKLADAFKKSKITSIDLQFNNLEYEGAVVMAGALHGTKITYFNFGGNRIGQEGAVQIAKSLPHTNITNMNLESNKLGDDGVCHIANVLKDTKITTLNLANNCLQTEGAISLTKILPDTKITSLNLSHNVLKDEGVINLVKILKHTQILSLNLGSNEIGEKGVAAIADALVQTSIRSLVLENTLEDTQVIYLAKILETTQLEDLSLQNSQIHDDGASAIARVLHKTKIKNLNLKNTNIGVLGAINLNNAIEDIRNTRSIHVNVNKRQLIYKAAKIISKALRNPQIKSLELIVGFDEDDQVLKILSALKGTQISSLHIECSNILTILSKVMSTLGDSQILSLSASDNWPTRQANIELLKNCPNLQKLTALNLEHNHLGDNGVVQLAKILNETKITSLDLRYNEITQKGVEAVFNILKDSSIDTLNLGCNIIEFEGAETIAKSLKDTKLTSLYLYGTGIGDEGVMLIASILNETGIKYLNLELNHLTCKAAVYIAKNLPGTRIECLNLSNNDISDEGAIALANSLNQTVITDLSLALNHIRDRGASAIATVLRDTQITTLDLAQNDIKQKGANVFVNALKDTNVISLDLGPSKLEADESESFLKTMSDSKKIISGQHSNINPKLLNDIEFITINNEMKINNFFRDLFKILSNENGRLEFVINNEELELAYYINITKTISRKKHSYLKLLTDNINIDCAEDQIKEFIENIELRLAEFLNKLDRSMIDKIKLLITCHEEGLNRVVESLLYDRPDYLLTQTEDKTHPLYGILHPAVYILMHEYGMRVFSKNMRPTKQDLIEIWQSEDWDDVVMEIDSKYSKKVLLDVLNEIVE